MNDDTSLLFSSSTDEYHNAMIAINKAKDLHEKELIRAKPEFNMCDLAAQVNNSNT